jgi:hypothetical protein
VEAIATAYEDFRLVSEAGGVPVGARQTFSAGFHRDLAEVWQAHGRDSMLHTAKTQPSVFFATCARLIGPEVKLTIEQSLPGNLSPADWADLRELLSAVQSALPDAADRPPGEDFRYALDALKCAENDQNTNSSICSDLLTAADHSGASCPVGKDAGPINLAPTSLPRRQTTL